MKLLLLLAALGALAAAMVPRERRAIDEEANTTTPEGVPICETQTPCGWVFYRSVPDHVESYRDNDYCRCGPNTECRIDEDDKTGMSLIKRCRTPES